LTDGGASGLSQSVSAISGIAGVETRIAMIRGRISSLTGSSAADSSLAAFAAETPGPADPTNGFDPFGAAYQAALQQAGVGVGPSGGSSPSVVSGFTSASSTGAVRVANSSRVASAGTVGMVGSGRSALSGADVARLAYNAGFRAEDLVKVVAISKRESNWTPTAFNGNSATNDLSYGLMQINMKDSLGPARLSQFGISANENLLDPQTNMNAAFTLYSRGGNSLRAWGGYKGMSDTFSTDIPGAEAAVREAGLL
jgi:hypothetical protein